MQAKDEKIPQAKEVRIEYLKDGNQPVLYVDGAVVRVTENNRVALVDFYEGSYDLLDEVATLNEKGAYDMKVDTSGKPRYKRRVRVTVAMPLEAAKGLVERLKAYVEAIEPTERTK